MWTKERGTRKIKKPPMKHALDAVNVILPCSQWEAAEMCFLQSGPIWMGCGAADCAELVIHRGTLTVCSGGRYLNQEAPTWVVREENGRGTVSMLSNRQKGDSAVKWFLTSATPETVCFGLYCLHVRLTSHLVQTGRAVSVALCIFSITLVVTRSTETPRRLIHFRWIHFRVGKRRPTDSVANWMARLFFIKRKYLLKSLRLIHVYEMMSNISLLVFEPVATDRSPVTLCFPRQDNFAFV